MTLTLVTAPADNPVTIAEAKAHLRVDTDDDDAVIGQVIAAAVAMINGPDGIGFAMVTQTWRLSLDVFPTSIRLPIRPVADDATVSITYVDADGVTQTLAADQYRLADGVIEPAYNVAWPVTRRIRSAVKVTFVAGVAVASVPADLKAAVLLLCGHLYENREAVVVGAPVAKLPLAVESILDRYRVGWVAA